MNKTIAAVPNRIRINEIHMSIVSACTANAKIAGGAQNPMVQIAKNIAHPTNPAIFSSFPMLFLAIRPRKASFPVFQKFISVLFSHWFSVSL